MSTDKLYERIESSGAQGVARLKLRKLFGKKTDKCVDELLSQGRIFAEKNGRLITYWSKDNYTQHLLNSDPKFKLIFDMYSNANTTISKINKDLNKKVATVTTELNNNGSKLTLEQFKMEFDRTLTEIPTSIGWVELAAIRERVCDKYSISKQNFYTLASQLFDQYNSMYELSSGGTEGVMVRGLVHGFVRCI